MKLHRLIGWKLVDMYRVEVVRVNCLTSKVEGVEIPKISSDFDCLHQIMVEEMIEKFINVYEVILVVLLHVVDLNGFAGLSGSRSGLRTKPPMSLDRDQIISQDIFF